MSSSAVARRDTQHPELRYFTMRHESMRTPGKNKGYRVELA